MSSDGFGLLASPTEVIQRKLRFRGRLRSAYRALRLEMTCRKQGERQERGLTVMLNINIERWCLLMFHSLSVQAVSHFARLVLAQSL